jgi:hypothetical protein
LVARFKLYLNMKISIPCTVEESPKVLGFKTKNLRESVAAQDQFNDHMFLEEVMTMTPRSTEEYFIGSEYFLG